MRGRWRLLPVFFLFCGCAPIDTVAVPRDAAPGLSWCAEQPPANFCADFDTSDASWTQFAVGTGTVGLDGTASKSGPRGLRTAVRGDEAAPYATLAIGLSPAKPRALRFSFDFMAQELPPEDGGVLVVQVRIYPAEGEAQDRDDSQHVELFLKRGTLMLKQIVPKAGDQTAAPARELYRTWTPGVWSHVDLRIEYAPREAVEVWLDNEPALPSTPLEPYVRTGPLNVTLGVVWIQPSRSASVVWDNIRAVVD